MKKTKQKMTGFFLDLGLRRRLERAAKKNGRSVSGQIRVILAEVLGNR